MERRNSEGPEDSKGEALTQGTRIKSLHVDLSMSIWTLETPNFSFTQDLGRTARVKCPCYAMWKPVYQPTTDRPFPSRAIPVLSSRDVPR